MMYTNRFGSGVDDHVLQPTKEILGGKGFALREMGLLKMPVPYGFTISTECCTQYQKSDAIARTVLLTEVMSEVIDQMGWLEGLIGHKPLVSVRSGARVSMPGMMDTILNVGITGKTMPDLMNLYGDRVMYDSLRRYMQMSGEIVHGIDAGLFAEALEKAKFAAGVKNDCQLSMNQLNELCNVYNAIRVQHANAQYPTDTPSMLAEAIEAVWESWDNPRARKYREMHGIPDEWGTAVNVQMMVFGNAGDDSCSGVVFTRSPVDGTPELYGEFLPNAQGEDVVAGIRTPMSINDLPDWNEEVAEELLGLLQTLEGEFLDMQDVEFTVEHGTLWLLQTRAGKRSAKAKFRIAYDLMKDKIIGRGDALKRVGPGDYLALKAKKIVSDCSNLPKCVGIPAGGTIVCGEVVFTSEEAVQARAQGKDVILLTEETTPDDIHGMEAAVGILTMTGGTTSHAAVVARAMNKTCVVGCESIEGDTDDEEVFLTCEGQKFSIKQGDKVTIDGVTGAVLIGSPKIEEGETDEYAERMIRLAMKYKEVVMRNEVREGAQLVYLDAMKFDDKNKFMIGVMSALDKAKIVVVDMASEEEQWKDEDRKFIESLGVASIEHRVNMSWVTDLPMDVRDRIWIVCGDDMMYKYMGLNYKVVSKPKSLDILLNGTPCMIEEVEWLGTKKARKQLLDMAKKTGIELRIVPTPVEKHRLLGDQK